MLNIPDILKNSLWQLTFFYIAASSLIFIGLTQKALVPFQLFAVILGIIAFFALDRREVKISKWWILGILAFCIAIRVIPYIGNEVPLGYDPGVHAFVFDSYFHGESNSLVDTFSPVLLYIIKPLEFLGTDTLVTWVFLIFSVVLGLCVYLGVKAWYGESAGIFAFAFYSLSYTQFLAFWYNYYKNIVGLCFLLLALWAYKQKFKFNRVLFIVLGGIVGGTHKPTYLMFFLAFLMYALYDEYAHREKRLMGNMILLVFTTIIAGLFYIRSLGTLGSELEGIITANIGAGTFIDYQTFAIYSLQYLPFALIGLALLVRQKKADVFAWWLVAAFVIVFFKIIFFNRFIIHLDLALICCAGYGISSMKGRWLSVLLILIVGASGFFVFYKSFDTRPLISVEEFNEIKNTQLDGTVIVTHRHYGPWVLGYGSGNVSWPGVYQDILGADNFVLFWTNLTEANELFKSFSKPLYIYMGDLQTRELDSCYTAVSKHYYKFVC